MTNDAAAREARPTFPHLENLERVLARDPEFLDQPVTVTEKIHGFNARVGRDLEGKVWVGTRSESYDIDDAPGLQGFTETARGFHDLPVGLTIYGEWAGKGVQKGIDYGEKRFYVFAERVFGGPVVSSRDALDQHLHLGATTVAIIYEGVSLLDVLDELRQGESVVAPGQPIEGVVLAPTTPTYDVYGHQVIAKFKSDRFAEIAKAPREPRVAADTEKVDAIAATYVLPERLNHVLDKVYESLGRDDLLADPLDVIHTGAVLRLMYTDVVEDAADEVAELSDEERKRLGSAINKLAKPLLDEARLRAMREAVAS